MRDAVGLHNNIFLNSHPVEIYRDGIFVTFSTGETWNYNKSSIFC